MKINLLAGVAITALLTGAASAADMRLLQAPPPAPFTWTGGYAGITAGGAWGTYDTTTSTVFSPGGYFPNAATVAAVNGAGPLGIKPGGFAIGIEAGYNWQSGALVLGVEADLQALNLNGAANGGAALYPGFSGSSSSAPMPTALGCSPPVRAWGSWPTTGCSMPPAGSPSPN